MGMGYGAFGTKSHPKSFFKPTLKLLILKRIRGPGGYMNIGREGYVNPSLDKLTRVHLIFDDRKIIMQKKLNNVKLFDLDI